MGLQQLSISLLTMEGIPVGRLLNLGAVLATVDKTVAGVAKELYASGKGRSISSSFSLSDMEEAHRGI